MNNITAADVVDVTFCCPLIGAYPCERERRGCFCHELHLINQRSADRAKMNLPHALEYAAEAIRHQDGGDPTTETGWRSEELLAAWLAIRAARPVDAVRAEREAIAAEARRYASHYPEASDGRNTFILLAEWIEARG